MSYFIAVFTDFSEIEQRTPPPEALVIQPPAPCPVTDPKLPGQSLDSSVGDNIFNKSADRYAACEWHMSAKVLGAVEAMGNNK